MNNQKLDVKSILPTIGKYSHIIDLSKNVWQSVINISSILSMQKRESSLIHPLAKIHPNAIVLNSIIGANVEVWEGCTIRDSIVLDGTVVGHGTEIARSVILENCFLPRFNYVGGSLLGEGVELGGCVMLATKRHDDNDVILSWGDERISTNQHKFGSIVGNNVKLAYGCHVNPGSVIGANCLIMPLVDVRGFVGNNSMVYVRQKTVVTKRRKIPYIGPSCT